jgi:hypothetical protein
MAIISELLGDAKYTNEDLAASAFYHALYSLPTATILPLAVDSLLNDKQTEANGFSSERLRSTTCLL